MTDHPMTPPLTDASQENKLVALALKQAQGQLEKGTASSQIITHFLKLASTKAQHDLEKTRLENLLLEAKIAGEESGQKLTDMIGEVLAALKSYSHVPPGERHDNLF